MVNRKDFRPTSNRSSGISQKDRDVIKNNKHNTIHHKIANSKQLQNHLELERQYTQAHHNYKISKSEKDKQYHAKNIKQLHYKVESSRKKVYKNKSHHEVLHKLHKTDSSKDLHKDIYQDTSQHKIINNTNETEHTTLVKHVVKPIESHTLQDIGRGIKSLAVGVGEVGAVALDNLGKKLQETAKNNTNTTNNTTNTQESYPSRSVEDIKG